MRTDGGRICSLCERALDENVLLVRVVLPLGRWEGFPLTQLDDLLWLWTR